MFELMAKYKVVDQIAPKWQELAYALHFESYEVHAIKASAFSNRQACIDMLTRWLDGQGARGPRTWRTLIEALRDIEKCLLACELAAALSK